MARRVVNLEKLAAAQEAAAREAATQGTGRHFTVWQVAWPNGEVYFGVRHETAESFRAKLRTAGRSYGAPNYTNPVARACRDWGVDNAVFEPVSQHDQEVAAIEIANGRIASLPADKRLNVRPLVPSRRRQPHLTLAKPGKRASRSPGRLPPTARAGGQGTLRAAVEARRTRFIHCRKIATGVETSGDALRGMLNLIHDNAGAIYTVVRISAVLCERVCFPGLTHVNNYKHREDSRLMPPANAVSRCRRST
jgi:hypothetical protein